jgi:phosphomannomutase/phosphoglucomutase
MFDDKVFKKYDIRGKFNEQFDIEFVINLAKGYCTYMINNADLTDPPTISVGHDARLSSVEIKEAFIKGLTESGFDALDIGLCPTPMVYYSLFSEEVSGGVMITASHNPPAYNGFKICIGKGSLFGDALICVKRIIEEGSYKTLDRVGSSTKKVLDTSYLKYFKDYFKKGGKKLKVAVDAGNGVGGVQLVEALKDYGCEVHELYIDPDGTFPNHHPDPTKAENVKDLIECVKENGLDIGIGLDGDGDRLGVIDNKGEMVFPDIYMILFCKDILKRRPDSVFISEVKCSQVLYDEVKRAGGEIIMFKTGHSLIKDKMNEINATLAGEMSGHVFFKDDYFGYDDAIYSAMRLVKILMESGLSLSELTEPYNVYESTPEIRVEVPDETKFILMDKLKDSFFDLKKKDDTIKEIITVDGARVLFESGWGLVRPSNTEPHFVLRFEADSKEKLDEIKSFVLNEVDKVLSH